MTDNSITDELPLQTTARYPLGLTVAAVAAIFVLLALAVYSVSERDVAAQYGRQQSLVMESQAVVLERTLSSCRSTLALFALEEGASIADRLERLHEELKANFRAVALLDGNGTVTAASPQEGDIVSPGLTLSGTEMDHVLRRFHQSYVGEVVLPRGSSLKRTLVVGVPLLGPEGSYQGAVLAVADPAFVLESLKGPPVPGLTVMFDDSGTVIYHREPEGRRPRLSPFVVGQHEVFRKIALSSPGFKEVTWGGNGNTALCIAAFAPVRVGVNTWWIVSFTPRNDVIVPVRKAAFNIIAGALGLMALVVVTSFFVSRSGARHVRIKEELKRAQERREWESRLVREKMTLEGVVQGSPVAMFVIDKDHKVILWNKACTDLTGYCAEEMVGTDNYYKPFYEHRRPFLADLIVDKNVENFDILYGEGRVVRSETIEGAYEAVGFFRGLNGRDRHLHFLAAPIYDENGEITAAIETFLDVTKEVELTRNLQEYNETLENELQENIRLKQEVDQLYRYLLSILDSLPDKVYELNKDGIINYVSRQIKTGMFDPKGKHFTEYVAPEHREYAVSKWEDAKRGIFKPYELEFTTKDGRKRHLLMTPGPVKGTDRFILVERDITELKELEKKYYESQKLAAIGQLSAGIAHEVRNPLSSIKMSLQILEKRMNPQGNDLKRFRIAQREVEHLEKLVNDVLLYARPSEPVKAPCDIRSVVDQALAMVEKPLEEKNIEVVKQYPTDIDLVSLDPSMMGQALINVFQNAVDAMEQGGRLTITLKEDPQSLVIVVEDTGCGIDEADIPYIFNPFFTRKSYGTGLGLSHVQKIVGQHAGTITVQSQKNLGTRFTIILPRKAP